MCEKEKTGELLLSMSNYYVVIQRDFDRFCILDNGIGIEDKYREKVFDIFKDCKTDSIIQDRG